MPQHAYCTTVVGVSTDVGIVCCSKPVTHTLDWTWTNADGTRTTDEQESTCPDHLHSLESFQEVVGGVVTAA